VRVEIKNALKRFGGRSGHQALAGVSLTATDGEFLVLLGPSGSGKTTLLRAIAGLESLDEGTILFGERRVNELEPGARNIGMVFQDYALYPHLSVAENISYNMKLRKIPRAEIERRVENVAAMLGIAALKDRKPSELSGGQRQRVALARAVTRDASVLLMDEPLSNLDAQIREHVRVELRELQKRLGVTTIYVTHDQVEAMVMADRIAIMNDGVIEQLGVPDDVYDHPETLFCARFVGSPKINEIAGTLRTGPGGASFELQRGGSEESVRLSLHVDSGAEGRWPLCVLAFRPEDVTVVDAGVVGLPAEVRLLENRGAERFAVAALPEDCRAAQVSSDLRIRVLQGDGFREGSAIRFLPQRCHVFDPESGRRICSGTVAGAAASANAPARASAT
jgi:ABC-type sugar transport system ATPase subunit